MNVVPFPTSLSTAIVPPCLSTTTDRAIANPCPAIALPVIRVARESARRQQCLDNLKFIGLALHNYADTYQGAFPLACREQPPGTPLLSWRFAVSQFFESGPFYNTVDQNAAWNQQPNPKVYINLFFMQCPTNSSKPTMTDYPAITGPGTAFPGPMKAVRFSEMTDGTSHTIVVGHLVKSDIVWLEPRDLVFNQMNFRLNDGTKQSLSSQHPGGVPLLRADGSVHFYANGLSPECLRAWLTIAGNEPQEMYELPP